VNRGKPGTVNRELGTGGGKRLSADYAEHRNEKPKCRDHYVAAFKFSVLFQISDL
jgi:hypothetical protein